MAGKRDLYLILGVSPCATSDEIKSVYRHLSKQYHPDVNQDNPEAAQEKLKRFTEAYQVLSDSQKRKEYDNQPVFHPRVPKGVQGQIKTDVLTKQDHDDKPSLWDKLKSFFIVDTRVKRDISEAMTHFAMGISMTEKPEFYENAVIEFKKAWKCDPLFLEAAFNLGLVQYRMGDFDQARATFKKILTFEKDDKPTKVMLTILNPEGLD